MWTDPTRRAFLARSAYGIGTFALAHLLQREGLLAQEAGRLGENLPLNLRPRQPHFAPKANAMISLFMHGGPSHVDLLDPKPELQRNHGRDYSGNVVYSFVNRASRKLMGSPFRFHRAGQSGTAISELLPHLAEIADDICVLRSMHTGHNGHEVSIRYFHGGLAGITGRPTLGSWIVYGLGSQADNLPAYMVLSDPAGHPVDGTHNWASGFMPPLYQGTVLRPQEPRIFHLDPPPPRRPAAAKPRPPPRTQPPPRRPAPRRGRPRNPHCQLRTRRPHAGRRPRSPRPLPRTRSDAAHVWPRPPRLRFLCGTLPDR